MATPKICTAKDVDDILDKIDKCLKNMKTLSTGGVKYQRAQHDILAFHEAARNIMMSFLQDKTDPDRSKLIAVFGGDCFRVIRMRQYVETTELSELHAKDKRKDMNEAACDSIENVLIDKGLAESLKNSRGRLESGYRPWEESAGVKAQDAADKQAAVDKANEELAQKKAQGDADKASGEAKAKFETEVTELETDQNFQQNALRDAIAATKAAIANKQVIDKEGSDLAKAMTAPTASTSLPDGSKRSDLANAAGEEGGAPGPAAAVVAPHKSRRVLNVLNKHSWIHIPGDFKSKVNLDNLLADLEAADAEEADRKAAADAKALADAIQAVKDAIAKKSSPEDLAKALNKPRKSCVLDVLSNHAWVPQDSKFQSKPEYDNLLNDLEAAAADAAQKKNDADKKALDDAIAAVEKAIANKGDPQARTQEEAKDLAKPSKNSAVKDVLAGHPWDADENSFKAIPDNEKLLNDLKAAKEDLARKQADDDKNALDDAIAAVEDAKANNKPPAELAKGLAKPSKSAAVRDILAGHPWDANADSPAGKGYGNFKSPPDVDKLLNDLKAAKAEAARKKAEDDKKALDAAIAAVKDAIAKKSDPKDLQKALADPAKNEEVEKVLGPHTWCPKPPPGCFKSAPDYKKLLDDLELCREAAARRKALDDAIQAVEDAIVGKLPPGKLPNKLEDPAKDRAVGKILKDHGWDPEANDFKGGPKSKPDLEKLLKDLKKGKEDEDKRKAIDDAIAAVQDAKANNKPPAELAKGLKAPSKDDDVKDILAAHAPAPWDPKGDNFAPGAKPDHDKLLNDLAEAKKKAAPPPFKPPNSEYVDPENPPVAIITVGSEIKPTFDFGDNGVMVMKLEKVIVTLSTKCEPPIPPEANPKPFEPEQAFEVVFDELKEVLFDKSKPEDKPGGKVTAVITLNKKVMEIPADIEVGVGSQTMSPWGSHKLLEGTKETELHFECHVASEFAMEEMDDESCELLVELKVTVTAWLTGVNSAQFNDGKIVEAPARAKEGRSGTTHDSTS